MQHGSSSRLRAIFNVTSGNFLEQYDFFLFGLYAKAIGETFFHSDSSYAALMKTFLIFAVSFLMRPIGALVLGPYVDRIGRRKGLMVTLSIMAVGSLLIALTPDYATLGFAATALIFIGRLAQGFSAGVELGGVSVYLSEIAEPHNRGFMTSWQSASQQVAVIFAATLGYVVSLAFTKAQVDAWAWRIPFFVGCAIIPFIFWLRKSLQETEAFASRKEHPTTRQILSTLAANWKIVLIGMSMVATTTTMFYFITVYTPTYGKEVLHLTTAESLIATVMVGASNFILLPIGGYLSDKFGRKPLLITTTTLIFITAYPLLSWLTQNISLSHMLMALLWLSLLYSFYNGALVVSLTEMMPSSVRIAGFSVAYSLATSVFGGLTPMIATYLVEQSGSKSMPAFWLMFAAIVSLIATLIVFRQRQSQNSQAPKIKAQLASNTSN
ncbi:MFS transporter [Acinetobacter ursingii]|uniref:MFS transporter n=1 Tax=Acinetobacter ursingii TaxID=108980 RepID=UPI0021E25198|nr:MFS transporter [Acinetobacter ursingii]MDA3578183.1 MFS transporter [Acinetobacter ursingii]MDG9858862.1 MFS transporter [Acinetobacter ursingii]MDG9892447.1 MFS transporter [Acinetobacter ursingii]MDH0006160.1 MFS transporter [Acinetobacter ursingii]MDH0477698.1 MFS transporter [Acinetobacter ursingii]